MNEFSRRALFRFMGAVGLTAVAPTIVASPAPPKIEPQDAGFVEVGGMLIQWGRFDRRGKRNPWPAQVTFPKPYSNIPWSVQCTFDRSSRALAFAGPATATGVRIFGDALRGQRVPRSGYWMVVGPA